MPSPTTNILFSGSTPAAPSGDQVATPQTDATSYPPFQFTDFVPKRATESLYGTVLLPSGGFVTAAQIQEESFIYAEDTGSANAYAIALSPAPSIGEGSVAIVKIAHANTGASTLAVNGGSATTIKKDGSTALASGDLSAGQIAVFVYDGTNWQLISGGGSSSGGGVSASEIQQEALVYGADTGSANAYAVALSPSPSLVAGSIVVFKAVHANTGASTLAVNGGSATAITKTGATALSGGEIASGQIVAVVYDGTEFQLQGGGGAGSSIYFGQGYATAGGGENQITLGSTPLAGSLSIFVAGSILAPSAYTLSGAVVALTSALSSGNIVVVNWATSNSTPGSITLSTSATPPAFVQGAIQKLPGSSVLTNVLAYPSANTAGNLLVVDVVVLEIFGGAGGITITDSQGNTWHQVIDEEEGATLVQTWYAANCKAGANTVTMTYSGYTTAPNVMAIHEYSGLTTSPLDTSTYAFGTGGNPQTIPLSLTTATAGELLHLIGAGGQSGNPGTTITNTAGWPTRESYNSGPINLTTFDTVAASAGSQSNSAVLSATYTYGYMVAFKA